MKTLLVARKSLREISREPQLLLLTILLPVAFVGITYLGYRGDLVATYPVAVIVADPGQRALVDNLAAQRHGNGQPVFDIRVTEDRAGAEAGLLDRSLAALLVIDSEAGTPAVTIKGDALYARYYRASVLLENAITAFTDRAAGLPEVVRIEEAPLYSIGPRTEFDLYAPGMIVFAMLMIVPQTAMLVARELRWRTLRRLRLSRLSTFELLAGLSLAQMVVGVVQVGAVFVAALALGFPNQGSLPLAIGVGLAIALSAIGQGLIVACFAENDSQAANVGSTAAMIQVFLSGAFYALPSPTILSLGAYQLGVFDIFPATHGFMALQQVLNYGAGLSQIAVRLGLTLLLSGLYFALGVFVFNRTRMRSHH